MPDKWESGYIDGDPGMAHVLPIDDLELHSVIECKCGAFTTINDIGIPVGVHSSYDCRELIEISSDMDN